MNFLKSLIILTFACLSLTPSAHAQTVGFADAIRILVQSCGNDINAHCKSASLANNEIIQCLQSKASRVSTGCLQDVSKVQMLLQARFAAQAAVPQLCDRDIQQRCNMVKAGSGNVLRCILKAENTVSAKCNQAIDAAGYR